jgi:hypothetical protein
VACDAAVRPDGRRRLGRPDEGDGGESGPVLGQKGQSGPVC